MIEKGIAGGIEGGINGGKREGHIDMGRGRNEGRGKDGLINGGIEGRI